MGFEMVDAEERLLMVIGQALGEGQADEERADEPGPLGHGVEVDLGDAHPRPRQGLADDGRDRTDVLARGQLRDDPAVRRMDLVLRQDDVAEDLRGARASEGGHVPEGRVPISGVRRTAAEVSSQDVSMASTSTGRRPFPLYLIRKAAQAVSQEEFGKMLIF